MTANMPAGMGEEERFAAAVENGTTPAFAGGVHSSAGELARDLEVVALLRAGGPGLRPDPAARERTRQRLMSAFANEFGHDSDGHADATRPLQVVAPVALASRTAATARQAGPTPLQRAPHRAGRHSAPELEPGPEQDAPEQDNSSELGNARRLRGARTHVPQRRGQNRAALVGAAAAAALVALAGTGTFASRDALPGDSMYGIKRVAESTGYALTFGEEATARRHLEQAQRRLTEVEGMVTRDQAAGTSGKVSGQASAAAKSDPELVRGTMQEFDSDATEGSRLLLAGADPDTAQVDEVRDWATEQSAKLSEIRETLPAPDTVDQSLALLDRMLGKTAALKNGACQPGASATGNGSADGSASASADGDCATAGSGATTGSSRTSPDPAPDGSARAGTGTSDTVDSDDTDENADTDSNNDKSTDGDDTSAGTSSRGSGSDDTDDRRRSDSSSDGDGSGGSRGSGGGGLPLPLPDVSSAVPGLSGVLGR